MHFPPIRPVKTISEPPRSVASHGLQGKIPTDVSGLAAIGLLLCFTLFAALGLQRWVGGSTVYSPELEDKRAVLHAAIVQDRPPEGSTWESLGARNTNTRIASVWLAEAVQRATGAKLSKVYWLIDTVFLWATLVLLFALLAHWMDPIYSLVGLLYFVSILPLTYLFYYFHPWDRMSQFFWVLLFLFVKTARMSAFVLALAGSMLTKYDTVLAPALYWLANVTRSSFWGVSLRATLLFGLSFAILGGLAMTFPHGASSPPDMSSAIAQVARNLDEIRKLGVTYPPLLVHLLPLTLAVIGWPQADQAARAGVVFGLGCLVPIWFLQSNFVEVRAQAPLIVLLLPAALLGLQRVVKAAGAATAGASAVAGPPTHHGHE